MSWFRRAMRAYLNTKFAFIFVVYFAMWATMSILIWLVHMIPYEHRLIPAIGMGFVFFGLAYGGFKFIDYRLKFCEELTHNNRETEMVFVHQLFDEGKKEQAQSYGRHVLTHPSYIVCANMLWAWSIQSMRASGERYEVLYDLDKLILESKQAEETANEVQ